MATAQQGRRPEGRTLRRAEQVNAQGPEWTWRRELGLTEPGVGGRAGGRSGLCEERCKGRTGCPSLCPLVFFYLAWHPPALLRSGCAPLGCLSPSVED